MFNYISDKLFDMKIDWITSSPTEKALKVVKAGADIAMLATGVGQTAKTVKTAKKLADCGKGAKMVATFTINAQKSNMVKAGTTMAGAAAVKATATAVEKVNDTKTSNTQYTGQYSTQGQKTEEEECKDRVRVKVRTGQWNRCDAINYVRNELYRHYTAPLDSINATMFVDEALK